MASRAGAYVRAKVDVPSAEIALTLEGADLVGPDGVPVGLTFVDLAARHSAPTGHSDRLTSSLQDQAHRLAVSDRILIRWPWLAGPRRPPDVELIETWIRRLKGAEGESAVLSDHAHVGVVQHIVGEPPFVRWSGPTPENEDAVLAHARAVEIHALLRRSNAIWEPQTYHYKLPNGEHVDVFVRLADAIQSPRDAFAISTWLTPSLRNGIGVVADSGSVTPLLLQIEAFLERFDWELGPVSILTSYPAARPLVRRSVESAAPEFGDALLGLQSVSSSGSLNRTLTDELERVAGSHGLDWSLAVVVDRRRTGDECAVLLPTADCPAVSWLGLGDSHHAEPAGTCSLCRNPTKAQFVAIDPRTYGEMALPAPHRVMPDTSYADAGHLFWERVSEVRGLAIEANPHPMSKVARGKRVALPVRPMFELIARSEGLTDLVAAIAHRVDIRPLRSTALVVTAEGDIASVGRPDFAGGGVTDLAVSIRSLLAGLGLNPEVPIMVDTDPGLAASVGNLGAGDDVLVFSWGSVTGLTLRRLKLAVADILRGREGVAVNGLLMHSRPSTPREWTAVQNQFRPGHLVDLWTSCLPWDSPLVDEERLLDRAGISPEELSEGGRMFLEQRFRFLRLHSAHLAEDDDWSPRFVSGPNPTHVLWGMSDDGVHQSHVRGRSLYGKNLDCVTAYAAIGSVIHYTRLNEQPVAAPRWVMFDLGRLVRSYFDAVITTCALRWLRPGELWWGSEVDDPDSSRDSVAYLIEQAADEIEEQVLLLPELLLAGAEGKIPAGARDLVRDRAIEMAAAWPDDDRYRFARGAVEVGVALFDATT